MWRLVWIIVGIMMLSACRSVREVEVPVIKTEYKVKTDTLLRTDSVRVTDSVMVWILGDTVIKERWHTQYRDRIEYRAKTDTMLRVDSVTVPVYVRGKAASNWGGIGWFFGGVFVGLLTLILIIGWLKLKGVISMFF